MVNDPKVLEQRWPEQVEALPGLALEEVEVLLQAVAALLPPLCITLCVTNNPHEFGSWPLTCSLLLVRRDVIVDSSY